MRRKQKLAFILQQADESTNVLPEHTYLVKEVMVNLELHLQQIPKEGEWSWSRRKLSSLPLHSQELHEQKRGCQTYKHYTHC